MPCLECARSREAAGKYRVFNPACLWCGARTIQQLPQWCNTKAEASQRRKVELDVWVAIGHAEAEIRALVALKALAYEPVKR